MLINFFWLFFFLRVLVFFLVLICYFSKSKFSVLGGLRASCVGVSFDAVFIFFCVFFVYFFFDLGFNFFLFLFIFYLVICSAIIIVLTDLNRGPFDFLEGESELVRGFNLELRRVFFVFFFISEYGLVFFFSYFIVVHLFYLGPGYFFSIFFCLVYFRVVLPRFRFDFLVVFCWVIILVRELLFLFLVLRSDYYK